MPKLGERRYQFPAGGLAKAPLITEAWNGEAWIVVVPRECHCALGLEQCMWPGQCDGVPPPLPAPSAAALMQPATISWPERFWRALGFGYARAHRPDAVEGAESGWSPGCSVADVAFDLTWVARLRVLVSGKIMVQVSTQMDVLPGRMRSWSDFRVLPPSYKFAKPTE